MDSAPQDAVLRDQELVSPQEFLIHRPGDVGQQLLPAHPLSLSPLEHSSPILAGGSLIEGDRQAAGGLLARGLSSLTIRERFPSLEPGGSPRPMTFGPIRGATGLVAVDESAREALRRGEPA